MTPGQAALAEAARLESARVYSRTVPQHHAAGAAGESPAARDDEVAYWRSRGQSVASIAFRLGVGKLAVRAALDRLGLTSTYRKAQ